MEEIITTLYKEGRYIDAFVDKKDEIDEDDAERDVTKVDIVMDDVRKILDDMRLDQILEVTDYIVYKLERKR